MPARDTILIHLISEVLEERPGLGANELYKAVTPLFCTKRGRTKLSKRHFFKYLEIMRESGSVYALGGRKRRKELELYLTEIGKKRYHQGCSEPLSIQSKSTAYKTEDGISQELKALYAVILYFNEGVSYKVYTKDAAEYILRSFGLSLSSLITRSERKITKSDSEDILQDIFQSPREDVTVYKDVFLRSDTHERGTTRFRLFLRGITCEAVLGNRDLKVFEHFKFTSEDIRNAVRSLCGLNVLKPVGSLGLSIDEEVIYKIDKSIFDLMFGLHTLDNGYDLFDKLESVMKEVWSGFRQPTEDEKTWLYFVHGAKEADQLINSAYESRKKITDGESMNSYVSRIRRNDKEKLRMMNARIDAINKEITKVKDDMAWIQESYGTSVHRHQILLNNIYETIYPEFFANLSLDRFGVKKKRSGTKGESRYDVSEYTDPTDSL